MHVCRSLVPAGKASYGIARNYYYRRRTDRSVGSDIVRFPVFSRQRTHHHAALDRLRSPPVIRPERGRIASLSRRYHVSTLVEWSTDRGDGFPPPLHVLVPITTNEPPPDFTYSLYSCTPFQVPIFQNLFLSPCAGPADGKLGYDTWSLAEIDLC
jgi:hypothetical protein